MKALLPVLFDKLNVKSRYAGPDNWRQVFVHDIEFLLNDAPHSADLKLYENVYSKRFLFTFYPPSLSQRIPINTHPPTPARQIQKIITSFKSRLDLKTIGVAPVANERQSYLLAILSAIYGTCSLPGNRRHINLLTAPAYSCGTVHVPG